jgi:hypothetical protein
MTARRATAYKHVLRVLDDLGPAKLHPAEQDTIRDAADAVLFSTDVLTDPDARASLDRAEDLVERLVDADRLLPETGESLLEAIEACGPATEELQLAA